MPKSITVINPYEVLRFPNATQADAADPEEEEEDTSPLYRIWDSSLARDFKHAYDNGMAKGDDVIPAQATSLPVTPFLPCRELKPRICD